MVGLSIVLETQKITSVNKKNPQVINKISMVKSTSHLPKKQPTLPNYCSVSTTSFLDHCFLCKQKLLLGKDIYMYKGDRAFCSVECRCRQIYMDEEESVKSSSSNSRGNYCSLAAIKPQSTSSSSTSSSRNRRGARNRANGFAY